MVSATPQDTGLGYVTMYQCLGLMNRLSWFPVTDSNTGVDVSVFNAQLDNTQVYIASRAGRTVGQVIADVLTQQVNANNISHWGVGNYTSLSPPTLPSTTAADLALLTLIPQHEIYVQGERLSDAIIGFLGNDAPNVSFYIQPDGTMRFLDHRTFTTHNFNADTDPIDRPVLSHGTSDCFSRVEVRGQPVTVGVVQTLALGQLTEDFGCVVGGTTYTNTSAKAAWTPADYQQPGSAQDTGTVDTGTETTTSVDVTSSDTGLTWPSNHWDQTITGAMGVVYLTSSSLGGLVTQSTSRKIIANTALTAGGFSTLTLNYPLPATNYDSYIIQGNLNGLSLVYRKYKVANTAIGAAMVNQFNYPVPWTSSSGNLSQLVSYPVVSIVSMTGTEEPLQANYDPTSGHIILFKPSVLVFGGGSTPTAPADIRALLAINQDQNVVYAPANSGSPPGPAYEGTFFTIDQGSNASIAKTLVVTCTEWRDPTSATAMQAVAQDYLDSCKDANYEGSVTYNGLYTSALTFGIALTISSTAGTTGWESPLTSFSGHYGLPVTAVDVDWDQNSSAIWRTTMHCSNRRAHYSATEFLRPARTFQIIGINTDQNIVTGMNFGGAFSQEGLTDQMMSNAQNFNTGSQESLANNAMTSAQNFNTGSQEQLADRTMDQARNVDNPNKPPPHAVAFESDGTQNEDGSQNITGGTRSNASHYDVGGQHAPGGNVETDEQGNQTFDPSGGS